MQCVLGAFGPVWTTKWAYFSSEISETRFDAKDIIMSKGCRAAYIHVAASGVSQLIGRFPASFRGFPRVNVIPFL